MPNSCVGPRGTICQNFIPIYRKISMTSSTPILRGITAGRCNLTNPASVRKTWIANGIELGNSWGFEYKTVAFVWDKMAHNPGKYTMSYCELCLVFKKGKIPTPRGTRNEKQLLSVPRRQHSEKPSEIRQAIERMFPMQRKIELFARSRAEDWDVWGLDVREEYDKEPSQENS